MIKVIVTDQTWGNLDIEHQVLASCDVELIDAQCSTVEELVEATRDADYLISQYAPLSAEVIPSLERCRVISRYGIGVDNIDLATAREARIPVCNVPDYCIDEVADHALALILALTRNVVSATRLVREGEWRLPGPLEGIMVLKELTIGLVGFGRIGRAVAERLVPFKCRVIAADPFIPSDTIVAAGLEPVSLEELLAESDVVSLHCPSDDSTRGMIDAGKLAMMKPGALFVNVSRGDIVVTDDLIEKLEQGYLRAAALDVTAPEPLPAGHRLAQLDNVVITSHFAACSETSMDELRERTAGAIAQAIRGEPLTNSVNGIDRPRQID